MYLFGGRNLRAKLERDFGRNPLVMTRYNNASDRMKDVRRYHDEILEAHSEAYAEESKGSRPEDVADLNNTLGVDEITWEDLEMDQVYLRINNCQSFIGEQSLYHRLHTPSDKEALETAESRIEYLDQNPGTRLTMQEKLRRIGKHADAYYLTTFLRNAGLWTVGNIYVIHLMQALLVGFLMFAAILRSDVLLVAGVGVAVINLGYYLYTKNKYDLLLYSLASFKDIYKFSEWVCKDSARRELFVSEEEYKAIQAMKKPANKILGISGRKANSAAGDISSLFADYMMGACLLDISAFHHVMKNLSNHEDEVLTMLEFVGRVDSDIAVLSYRKSIDTWCKPELGQGNLSVANLTHPLLPDAVANSLTMAHPTMITGANASGKSTFMKAVAINCILAQTIYTCTAESMALPRLDVMTCMALRDDVLTGESYYFREAKHIKRMLDQVDLGLPVLCIIDEILKGTNTVERLAASHAILEHLTKKHCHLIVATHDLELTNVPGVENYHFESQICDGDIKFDYKIKDGVSRGTNAIDLLEVLGYDEKLVASARGYLATT